jgi:AmpD protein
MRGRRSRNGLWLGGWWHAAIRRPSPNANERPGDAPIELVVLHSISLPAGVFGGSEVEQLFLNTLDCDAHPSFDSLRSLRVSAHFFIRRDGRTLQFVPVQRRAWHAGLSRWWGREACNDFSLGIELEGLEGRDFTPAQMRRLADLLNGLCGRWPIRAVVGHEHVAPGRKRDPGPGFDWAALAQALRPRIARRVAVWNPERGEAVARTAHRMRATTGKR